jgi:MFS transporter, NNP family, nitrate/nitrite transporter
LDDVLNHRHPDPKEPRLNETEFGLVVGTPILTGSLIRLMLGIWTDQYGG